MPQPRPNRQTSQTQLFAQALKPTQIIHCLVILIINVANGMLAATNIFPNPRHWPQPSRPNPTPSTACQAAASGGAPLNRCATAAFPLTVTKHTTHLHKLA